MPAVLTESTSLRLDFIGEADGEWEGRAPQFRERYAPQLVPLARGIDRLTRWKPALSWYQGLHWLSDLRVSKKAMAAVVNESFGTAYAARIPDAGMEMAGKTGTAQVRHISDAERAEGVTVNEKLPWKERDHALFGGFAPTGNPRYAIGVVVEHGGSGAHVAVPIARDVLLECQLRDAKG